ncbi:hypothetical protein ACH5RR_028297 [Cinchona calisaya]|uniref:Uncharacterized protein n=1 Tax=Cinchona calisaya TaxID=153742 RepID=A0ABD2YNC1_9GENT
MELNPIPLLSLLFGIVLKDINSEARTKQSTEKEHENAGEVPMQQHMRSVGANVGMEKVRVSIGSREKMAHRVLSNARRGAKDKQQKKSKREKERGLNIGSAAEAARTIL